ncbi:hypothetical protein Tco_1419827 [Tanacetum coccineum]
MVRAKDLKVGSIDHEEDAINSIHNYEIHALLFENIRVDYNIPKALDSNSIREFDDSLIRDETSNMNTGPLFETYTSIINFAKELHGDPPEEMRTNKDEGLLEHTSAAQQQVQSTRSPFALDLRVRPGHTILYHADGVYDGFNPNEAAASVMPH